MAKPKTGGLGRGLDSIFLDNTSSDEKRALFLKISRISPEKNQPRKKFDEEALEALAESIREHGVIQPIAVRETDGGYYKIIAGERRWRAAKAAGLTEIPAVVMTADDRAAAELALIENLQREDLGPLEEAEALRALSDRFGMTQERLARVAGKSRSAVANTMRLCDLPEEIKPLVEEKKLSEGHARALLAVKDKKTALALANETIEKDYSVRQTELAVRRAINRPKKPAPAKSGEVDYTAELARKMSGALGKRVRIAKKAKSGTLSIDFEDTDDLNELAAKLCGKNIFKD